MIDRVAAVTIGRNEGARLVKCLAALSSQSISPIVYVDSGSTDASVLEAERIGAVVVKLDTSIPFTAARARNAGWKAALEIAPDCEFLQFIDGDCEMVHGWLDVALTAFGEDDQLGVVCGRRRELYPEASLWNRMIDREWDTPVGETMSCGGDALMRRVAVEQVGGYREDLIAGEEPELCFRMRANGWKIRRVDAEMTRHDAALSEFSQWWKRSKRAGHAFAEGSFLHGRSPERFYVKETRRSLVWGAWLPILILLATFLISPWILLGFLIYPLQILRLKNMHDHHWEDAIFLTLAKFAEAKGAILFHYRRLANKRKTLIEYK